MCRFGVWKSIESRSGGRIERRCDVPPALGRDIGRIGGVLASGEEGRNPHGTRQTESGNGGFYGNGRVRKLKYRWHRRKEWRVACSGPDTLSSWSRASRSCLSYQPPAVGWRFQAAWMSCWSSTKSPSWSETG